MLRILAVLNSVGVGIFTVTDSLCFYDTDHCSLPETITNQLRHVTII